MCSYVLPYFHSPRNLKILRSIIDVLGRDPRVQIIIVETGEYSRLNHVDLKATHVFVPSNTWNVGWLFNCGFIKTKTDHLFFGSMEYLPRLEVIHSIMKDKDNDKRHCVYLQDKIIRLDKQQTDRRQLDSNDPGEEASHEGITYYTRDGYFIAGGWDENVYGKDLYDVQDKRNKSSVNVGRAKDASTFNVFMDLPLIEDKMLEYSKQHKDKIMGLEKNVTINYLKVQSRHNANFNKYFDIGVLPDGLL